MVNKSYNVNGEKLSMFSARYRWQILATISVHILTFTHGVGVGWLSPSLRLLGSDESPLGKPLTIEEASWLGSLIGLGALAGNVIFGLLLDIIGRKLCMFMIAFPNMIYWILIYTAQDVNYLYAGRFLAGLSGGGCYVCLPIFITEIADTNIRGALSSVAMLNVCFGMLLGFTLATYLSYYLMPCIIIALPILYLIAIFGLSETPPYLLKRGRIEQAEKSYRFYKNLPALDDNPETAQQDAAKKEFEQFKQLVLKGSVSEKVTWKDFFNRPALKIFMLIFVLIVCNQISGSFALFNYTSHIFGALESKLDINNCTIVVGVAQLVGIISDIALVDRFGRRVLLLTSFCGMALGELSIGLLMDLSTSEFKASYSWLPLLLMSWVAFISALGVTSLIFTIVIELLPAKIRSTGTSLSMATFSLFIFISLKIYPLMIFNKGLGATMYMSASFATFGFIFLGLLLPETKGKLLAH